MQQQVLSILTRTPMHVGAGASVGVVDLPIIRERHTGYPVIPGSSLKGVLAALWTGEENLTKDNKRIKGSDLETLFGRDDFDSNDEAKKAQAGKLLVGEAKILAFPVRSAKNAFAWCTCPMALARAKRDLGFSYTVPSLTEPEQCLAPTAMRINDKVILEEYCLAAAGEIDNELTSSLQSLSDDDTWQEELASHLVVLSDEMFSYFVQNACEIAQHVKIDPVTCTAEKGGLFNQENVPSETMFYALMTETKDEYKCLEKLAAKLLQDNNHILQIGADATTGLGWCTVKMNKIKA